MKCWRSHSPVDRTMQLHNHAYNENCPTFVGLKTVVIVTSPELNEGRTPSRTIDVRYLFCQDNFTEYCNRAIVIIYFSVTL